MEYITKEKIKSLIDIMEKNNILQINFLNLKLTIPIKNNYKYCFCFIDADIYTDWIKQDIKEYRKFCRQKYISIYCDTIDELFDSLKKNNIYNKKIFSDYNEYDRYNKYIENNYKNDKNI